MSNLKVPLLFSIYYMFTCRQELCNQEPCNHATILSLVTFPRCTYHILHANKLLNYKFRPSYMYVHVGP